MDLPCHSITRRSDRRNQQVRFPQRREVRVQVPQGPGPEHRRGNLGDEARAGLDARVPPEEPGNLRVQAHAALGRRHRHQVRGHLLLPQAHRPARSRSWDDVPAEIKSTFDRLGIPEAEKKFLAGVKAQYESEVVYGSLKEEMSRQGVIFTDTDSAVREHPDLLREYFGTIIPPERQQVRRAELGGLVGRIVHLRAAGGEDRVPLAGLLPHQRRQHGPVRADADHRRRGRPGALRRGLHGPDVQRPKACTRPWSR